MTHPALVPPRTFAGPQEVAAALRAGGGRVSTSMRLLIEALFAGEAPRSAETLAGEARLDPSSVYRNLERLEALGVVRHVHIGHGPGLYALAADPEREYVVCDGCGAVRAVPGEELEGVRAAVAAALDGHEARFSHFPMHGLCAACAARAQLVQPVA